MKVEFTFDKEQIQRYGYTVDAVRQTILRGFAAKRACAVSPSMIRWLLRVMAAKKIFLIYGPF